MLSNMMISYLTLEIYHVAKIFASLIETLSLPCPKIFCKIHLPQEFLSWKEVSSVITLFLTTVAANVVSGVSLYFICKWLDRHFK